MVLSCSATGCKSRHSRGSGIKFHRYPADEELKNKWSLAVNAPWFVPTQYSVVCSRHFDDADYKTNVWGKKYLNVTAIPKPILSCQSMSNGFEAIHQTEVGKSLASEQSPSVSTSVKHESDKLYLNTSSYSTMNYDDSLVLEENEEVSSNVSISEKILPNKRRKLFRYLGDYTEDDLETPRKRKMFCTAYKNTLAKKEKTERLLKRQNKRLQMKIKSLNALIDRLQADNKISANCSNMLMVNDEFPSNKNIFLQ